MTHRFLLMRRLCDVIFGLLLFINLPAHAQCIIDTSNHQPGFTPGTLRCITAGVSFGGTQQLYVPLSTNGGAVTIDSVVISGITGLPAGITYALNPPSGIIYAGQSGCIWFSGTTTAASGAYPLVLSGSVVSSAGTGSLSSFVNDTLFVCSTETINAYTLGRDPLGHHCFNLYGSVNSGSDSTLFSFVYTTDSTFSTADSTPWHQGLMDPMGIVWAEVDSLIPNTTYYYYLTVQGATTSAQGAVRQFFSDTLFRTFDNAGGHIYGYGDNVADFDGTLSAMPPNTGLFIQWGETPELGNVGQASPPVTPSDSSSTYFSLFVQNLAPGQTYFFRCMAANSTDTFYTDIKAYYNGMPFTTLQILPGKNITDSSVVIQGLCQGFPVPVKLGASLFASSPPRGYNADWSYYPSDTAMINYSDTVTGLYPGDLYSGELAAQTWIGTFYPMYNIAFFAGNLDSIFQTRPAVNITGTNADVTGYAHDNFGYTVNVGFEYGIDSLLGNYVYNGDSIPDSLPHYFSARLNGLQPATTYYYRLVGGGLSYVGAFYGDILNFTTDTNINAGVLTLPNSPDNISIYPNPCSSVALLSATLLPATISVVQLVETNGQVVKEMQMPSGQNSLTVDVSDLQSGIYVARLIAGEMVYNRKLVVIR